MTYQHNRLIDGWEWVSYLTLKFLSSSTTIQGIVEGGCNYCLWFHLLIAGRRKLQDQRMREGLQEALFLNNLYIRIHAFNLSPLHSG